MSFFYKESFPEDTVSLEWSDLSFLKDLSRLPSKGLILDNNRIHRVSGEELPSSLTHLSISFNGISMSGLPVHPHRNLKTLILTNNQFYYVSSVLGELFPQLDTLNVQANYIEETAFLSSLSRLKHLNVKHNDIRILHSLPKDLETLQASECKITMIQSKLPSETKCVYLPRNKLRFGGLPLNWGQSLRYLDLSRNKIEKFPRKLPNSLEHLNLSHNLITSMPSTLPSNLKSLHLGHNHITSVPSSMNGIKLQLLFVSNNHITHEIKSHITWANVIYDDGNWNEPQHHIAQKKIRRFWHATILQKRVRIYRRSRMLLQELMEVAMHPSRCHQIDTVDQTWFRKDPNHNHTDHRMG